MNELRLIALDFDGTIIGAGDPALCFHPAAIEALNVLEGAGVRWCTNSGRGFEGQVGIVERSRMRGLRHLPAGLLCSETYIYHWRDGAYVPDEEWNGPTHERLCGFHRRVRDLVLPRVGEWAVRYVPRRIVLEDEVTALLVQDDGRAPAGLQADLQAALDGREPALVTRNSGWLMVIPAELGKGRLLRAYRDRRGYRREEVLAIGDHLNDLTMLDGEAAAMIGCPADADDGVIRAVRAAGGRVASAPGPLGTVEVIRHFLA